VFHRETTIPDLGMHSAGSQLFNPERNASRLKWRTWGYRCQKKGEPSAKEKGR
jgi:hypothetical protein